MVLLARRNPLTIGSRLRYAEIEEDLTGTRKIARSGIRDSSDLRAALLPLLPLQSAPKLEAVDITSGRDTPAHDATPTTGS